MKETKKEVKGYKQLLDEMLHYPSLEDMVEANGLEAEEVEPILKKSRQLRTQFGPRVVGLSTVFEELSNDWFEMPRVNVGEGVFMIGERRYCYSKRNVEFFESITSCMKAEKLRCLGWISFVNELAPLNTGPDILRSILTGNDQFDENQEYGFCSTVNHNYVIISHEVFEIACLTEAELSNSCLGPVYKSYKRRRLCQILYGHEKAYLDKLEQAGDSAKRLLEVVGVPIEATEVMEKLLMPTLFDQQKQALEKWVKEIEED